MLDLLTNFLVLLVDHVDVRVERINIVEQGVVLLFRLDEGRHDLLDGADTSLLLDLVEGVLDNFDVAGVHIHQSALFPVLRLPPLQAGLH